MEEMTFEEFSREVNNIYKKNCEVYYKLASHFGMTETMFDILYFVRENDGGYTQAQLCESLPSQKADSKQCIKKAGKGWRNLFITGFWKQEEQNHPFY